MKALKYYDRSWSEIDFEDPSDEHGRPSGWSLIRQMGDEPGLGLGLRVYERVHAAEEGEPRYLATYTLGSVCQYVVLQRAQDFIDFLAHVSPTLLLATLPEDAMDILEDLAEKTPTRIKMRADIRREATERRAAAESQRRANEHGNKEDRAAE